MSSIRIRVPDIIITLFLIRIDKKYYLNTQINSYFMYNILQLYRHI